MSTRPHDLAFPLIDTTGIGGPYLNLGLTKREYFAAMAMQGMLAGVWTTDDMSDFEDEPEAFREHQAIVAGSCVSYADALIAALNKEPQP